ncbi:efflux RND transporter permease subunit [Hazenella coriacea]|uniref:Glycerophosphoryl diester phosphodiesterase family protein n=1 Tax=Hazenella coriacea TaxID=1179467 RepID=A0A4R3LBI0_9BACL|nr:efflux RND transporter permease subunit [Hazenella coriacea]TCS96658.1 hypothetical protein EDD58_101294 [Hazenella coriacea]
MLFAFRHSLKLSWINLLGLIISHVLFAIGAILLVSIAFLFGAGGTFWAMIGTDYKDPAQLLESSIATGFMFLIILVILYILLIFIGSLCNSIWMGGTYAFSLEASQNNSSTIGTYFSKAFLYMFKLTWMSFIFSFVVVIPVMLVLYLPLIILDAVNIVPSFVLGLLFISLFIVAMIFLIAIAIHAPIFIIQEGAGAWKSIALSMKLFFRSIGQMILSALAYLSSFIIIVTVMYLIMLCLVLVLGAVAELTGNEAIPGVIGLIFLVILYLLFIPLTISFPILWISDRYNKKLRQHLFPPSNGSNEGHMHFRINQQPFNQPFTFDSPPSSNQPPKLDL